MNAKKNFKKRIGAILFIFIFFCAGGFVDNSTDVMHKLWAKSNYGMGFIPSTTEDNESVKISDVSSRNLIRIPSRADITRGMPPVGSQGSQGSCVGWATTYAIKTYHEKLKNRWNYGTQPQAGGSGSNYFSPAWTYNQINNGRDRGSVPTRALALLKTSGAITWRAMPYNARNYTKQPSYNQKRQAVRYKIRGYKYVSIANLRPVKEQIAKGYPVLTGVKVYKNFYKMKRSVLDHNSGSYLGGHAIVIVGYDDYKRSPRGHKGAFKLYNSWGKYWGVNGTGWISYKHFASLCLGTYIIEDHQGTIKPKKDNNKKNDNPPNFDPNNNKGVNAPASVYATKGTYRSQIMISWSKVTGAVAYKVQRANSSGSYFRHIGSSSSERYSDKSIVAGKSYRYRVIAVGNSGSSNAASSPVAEGYAMRQVESKPGRVAGLTLDLNNGRVTLKWNKDSRATGYIVWRYLSSSRRWAKLSKTSNNQFYDRRVPTGTVTYTVRAQNNSGYGPFSVYKSIVIRTRLDKPGTVAKVRATQGFFNDRIVVVWKKVDKATSYFIYRYDKNKRKWKTFTVYKHKFIDKTAALRSGGMFSYYIKAKNNSGYSKRWSSAAIGYVDPYMAVSRSLGAVKAPKTKRILNSRRGTITLKWNKVKNAKAYTIYRKREGERNFKKIRTVRRKTRYREMIPGSYNSIYLYTVRAQSQYGSKSSYSNIVAGFKNRPTMIPRSMFVKGKGLKNFYGIWKTVEIDKRGNALKVSMTISGRKDRFRVVLWYGPRSKVFTGYYAAGSRYLKTSNFQLKILKQYDNDIAMVSIENVLGAGKKKNFNVSRKK